MEVKLTPKQSRFIDEYMKDYNATQAAIRTGYSKKTAFQIGYENLKKPEIRAEIDRRIDEIQEEVKMLLKAKSDDAVRYLLNVVTGKEEGNADRIRAARDWLDRSGLKAAEERQINVKGELHHEYKEGLDERLKKYDALFQGDISGNDT